MKKLLVIVTACLLLHNCSSSEDGKNYVTPEIVHTETLLVKHTANRDNYCYYNYEHTVGEPYEIPFERNLGYGLGGHTYNRYTGNYYSSPQDVYAHYSYSVKINGNCIDDNNRDSEVSWMRGGDSEGAEGEQTVPSTIRLYGQVNKGDVIEIIEIKDAFE